MSQSGPPIADIAARMDPDGMRELQAAGIIDSKFGPVTLLGLAGARRRAACLGFMKAIDDPDFRISGWSCQGDTLPARRAAIGCILNRLILLTAGNDPKLAELFAQAELRRGGCAPTSGRRVGRLGDRRRKPPAARQPLTRRIGTGQDTGFHATFSLTAALL